MKYTDEEIDALLASLALSDYALTEEQKTTLKNLNEKQKAKIENRVKRLKKAGTATLAGLVATGVLASSIAISKHTGKKSDSSQLAPETPIVETFSPPAETTSTQKNGYLSIPEEPIYIARWSEDGEEYYFCTEEYVQYLAQQSLLKIEKIFTSIDGVTPVASGTETFYPEYFNYQLLTALANTESSYRIKKVNGEPMKSKDGALGMTQVLPETLDDVNEWLRETIGVKDLQYTPEDLLDPSKAMEVANLALIMFSKNHCKEDCNNPIHEIINRPFSFENQEQYMLCIYNNGIKTIADYQKAGVIDEYLIGGSEDAYVNKVLRYKEYLMSKTPQSTLE